MAISAWRKKPHVQLIALLDSGFVILMIILHSYNFIVESRRNLELLRGLLDINEHWGLYVLIWVSAYIVNFVQLFVAFSLFLALQPDYPDAQVAISKSQRWLRFSSFIFLCLLVKFLLYMCYLLMHGRVDALTLLVALADIVFRMVTVYMVKRFVDDLKVQYPGPPPSVFFIKLFSKKSNSNTNEI